MNRRYKHCFIAGHGNNIVYKIYQQKYKKKTLIIYYVHFIVQHGPLLNNFNNLVFQFG